MYADEHRKTTKLVKYPMVEYGISLMDSAHDYIVGSVVSDFEDVPSERVAVTIPAG